MAAAFLICTIQALLAVIYAPRADSAIAFIYITISATPLLVPSFIKLNKTKPKPNEISRKLHVCLWTCGLLNVAVATIASGNSVQNLLSLNGILKIASDSTVNRYVNDASSGNPLLLAISLFHLYLAGSSRNNLNPLRAVVLFTPLCLYALVTTEKYPLFLGFAFYATSLIIRIKPKKDFAKFSIFSISILTFGFTISVIALSNRGRAIEQGGGNVAHYLLAPYPAFGDWLKNSTQDTPTLGKYTFIGPLGALGLAERISGVFQEQYHIKGQDTNIMTAWKYLIIDFTMFGPILITSAASICYILLKSLHQNRSSEVILVLAMLCSLLSQSTPPFAFNSVILALSLSLLSIFALSQTKHKKLCKDTTNPQFKRHTH